MINDQVSAPASQLDELRYCVTTQAVSEDHLLLALDVTCIPGSFQIAYVVKDVAVTFAEFASLRGFAYCSNKCIGYLQDRHGIP